MPSASASAALTRQQLRIDFAALKFASPKGVYVAPSPDEPLQWAGILFLRKGPYANAILRFKIDFPDDFPQRPPVISFLSDVFHPLVTPLTTYTYSTRDTGAETVSAVDEHRLPPGGLSLRHGFPEWFTDVATEEISIAIQTAISEESGAMESTSKPENSTEPTTPVSPPVSSTGPGRYPHVIQVLQYLRVTFDTEEVLDSIPLETAANTGAWHAWRSFRSKAAGRTASPVRQGGEESADSPSKERPLSPRKQPGGARRPGEWNWQGVWEDRVRKSIQASNSEPMLFGGGDGSEVIGFLKMDPEEAEKIRAEQGAAEQVAA